jgi:hypothetical protein
MPKEISVQRIVISGLFLTAALLTAPVFASNEGDQCRMNLQNARDAQVSHPIANLQVKGEVETTLHRAEAAQARNNDDGNRECISLTTQAMQKIQSN